MIEFQFKNGAVLNVTNFTRVSGLRQDNERPVRARYIGTLPKELGPVQEWITDRVIPALHGNCPDEVITKLKEEVGL